MRWGTKSIAALTAALICGALWAPAAHAVPPANDNFAGRQMLDDSLPIAVSGTNVGATQEGGEPLLFTGKGRTIWFQWAAETTGYVTVGTCGTGFRTLIGLYTGTTLGGLTAVPGRVSGGPGCVSPQDGAQVTFKAEAGSVYVILVDGDGFYLPPEAPPSGEGTISLQIETPPSPPNDAFSEAMPLAGRVSEEPDGARFYFVSQQGHNWIATKESGEPNHDGDQGGASVWYAWTAPESGSARVSICCVGPQLLGVYAGSDVGSLTKVGSGRAFVAVPVIAGTTYRIAVDGRLDGGSGAAEMGSFSTMVAMVLPPGPGFGTDLGLDPSAVDRAAPRTSITASKVRPRKRSATFRFASSEAGGFKCSIDRGPFAKCVSPKTYRSLAPDRHTFRVVATDLSGNVDASPAVSTFRIPKPKPRSPKR